MKNNSGFTMIELLAAIVILGIMMGSAIPIVISVMNDQKNKTYIEDAIRLASNADNKNVIWSSSNPDIASVKDGIVTAHKLGSTTITVKTEDGSFMANTKISVEKNVIIVIGFSPFLIAVVPAFIARFVPWSSAY